MVGSTGKQLTKADGSYFYQSGEIDQTTNTFYLDCVDNNQQSTLYTVNLTTGQLTEVGQFANNNIISILTIPKAKAADNYDFSYTNGKPCDIYSPTGQLVRKQAHSLNGLPSGVYVVKGKKILVK